MKTTQPLPACHAEMDEHHLHVFRRDLPWWFRPVGNATGYSVEDFRCDVRQRMEAALAELEPSMGKIFRERKILAQVLSCHIARHSANVAKVGYSTDEFTTFIRESLAIVHKYRCFGIPKGDPLHGKYHSHDLTVPERRLVRWLHEENGISAVLQRPEFSHYASRSPETRFVLYSPDFRRKMREILAGTNDDEDDEEWREACIDLAIDELNTVGGTIQQQRVNDLRGDLSYDPLDEDPRRSITDLITPNLADPKKKHAYFALLEQLIVVAAAQQNVDDIIVIVGVWNRLMEIHNVAPCERPTGGLAAIIATCAVERAEAVQGWFGPK